MVSYGYYITKKCDEPSRYNLHTLLNFRVMHRYFNFSWTRRIVVTTNESSRKCFVYFSENWSIRFNNFMMIGFRDFRGKYQTWTISNIYFMWFITLFNSIFSRRTLRFVPQHCALFSLTHTGFENVLSVLCWNKWTFVICVDVNIWYM